MKNTIKNNYIQLQERIENGCIEHSRSSDSVQLLAVSKKQSADAIRDAYQLGIRSFGENYLQEALAKQIELSELDIEWHFIGPVQSNKTNKIATHFTWLHTVDRLKIAQRLDSQRDAALSALNCCIQMNTSGEDNKAGISDETTLLELATFIDKADNLALRGLMCIPSPDAKKAQTEFQYLAKLRDSLKTQFPDSPLDTLSMGMSQDLEIAIGEGATMIRVGTALFGARE